MSPQLLLKCMQMYLLNLKTCCTQSPIKANKQEIMMRKLILKKLSENS